MPLTFRSVRRAHLRRLAQLLRSLTGADNAEESRLGDDAVFGVYFAKDATITAAVLLLETRVAAALAEASNK